MKEKKQSLKSKVTYVKKNWMLYIFFLMPAPFTDNYIQVCSDGRTAHSIQGLQCHKGCAGESMGRA